jgi:ABC-2 type transport system ATP-binding protein
MSILRTEKLSRRFGDVVAVRDLDLEIGRGGVVGLVGPNGSGKSTLIRLLLGLIRPTSGSAFVFDAPVSRPRVYAARVGALIESPAFSPTLSARANLRSLARLRGIANARVDEVLAIVGLMDRSREPAKRFSLGMKQRLGIAAALLPDPELLVLDEPTNGLDPAGIVEIRQLLRAFGDEGRTVIVSSHLLSEIEAACDTLAVIRFGDLLYSGPLSTLVAQAGGCIAAVPEHLSDAPRLRDALAAKGWRAAQHAEEVQVGAPASLAADVNRAAAEAGITLRSLGAREASLEDVFLRMTGEASGDDGRSDREPGSSAAGPDGAPGAQRTPDTLEVLS